MNHRRPARYGNKGNGNCRYCGLPIDGRARWHPECLHRYKMANWAGYARGVIFKRDHGVCAKCGDAPDKIVRPSRYEQEFGSVMWSQAEGSVRYCPIDIKEDWHLDHIVPLIDGGAADETNMQTLCPPCHKAKTKREAGERAARRRAQRLPLEGRA